MRRMLAATLVLALTAGVPATASAQEPSEGESADGAEAPQPPPRGAVILTVDKEPYEARIDDFSDVDWYRFTAVGGRDYWIVADIHYSFEVDVTVSVHDASGAEVEVTRRSDHGELRWVLLSDAAPTTYFVRVSLVENPYDSSGDYGIEIRAIDDDHGDTAAEGTPVRLGSADVTEFTGRTDYDDDQDWLLFDARAGDLFRITARYGVSVNVYMVGDAGETVGDPLAEWGTSLSYGEMDHKPWRFAESGRYALSLRDDTHDRDRDYPFDYTVTFERLDDDHANLPDDPSPLRVDRRTDAELNYDYDEDWFEIQLVAGEQYLVEFLPGESPPRGAEVILYGVGSADYQDEYIRQRHTLYYPGASRRVWKPGETGLHLVNVRTSEDRSDGTYPTDYSITVSPRPPDDHADGPEGADEIRSGAWLEANLDISGDEDWYRFDARPGVVYAAEFAVRLPGSSEFEPLPRHYSWRGTLAYFIDDNWGFEADSGYVFGDGGMRYLVFTTDVFGGLENVDYRFRLVEYESVDYGDDRTAAHVVGLGETVTGSATDEDSDWFAFDALAGGIYTISSGSGATSVTVFDATGEVPSRNADVEYYGEQWSGRGLEFWTAPAPGRYWIRLAGRWTQPHIYHLSLTYTPATVDDHGDTAEEATGVFLGRLLDESPVETPAAGDGSTGEGEQIAERRAFVEGRLQNFLDEDWFAFRLERGVKYRIVPHAPDSGYYRAEEEFNENVGFALFDGETYIISRQNWNPTLGFVPTKSGTYHLWVGPARGEPFLEPLDYNFAVEVLYPDDYPELRESAQHVAAGDVLAGTLNTPGDLDWFRFNAVAGQTWILQSTTDSFGCAQVYGPGEDEPFVEQCREERVVWVVRETGEHGLRLSARVDLNWHQRTPSDYRLQLTVAEPDDHGNSALDASTLVAGAEQTGAVDYDGDRDVFTLAVAEGEVWTFDLSSSNYATTHRARFKPSGGDADPRGSPSRYAAGGFLGAPADGSWLITVAGDKSLGTYTLLAEKLDVTDDHGNDRDHARALAGPAAPAPGCERGPDGEGCSSTTSVAGRLDYTADSDYFRVALQAGTKYEISVSSESGDVIFTLLTEDFCALEGPTVWEKDYETWVPTRTEDYWLRVGFGDYRSAEPVDYTLEVTAHGEDFLTITERAPQLEPNVVHEVSGDESTGRDLYKVSVDHSRYVIEVNGNGFRAGGISPSEQFDFTWWTDESRYIVPLPSDPPPVYFFRVTGPAGEPYTVVVREHVPSDNDLEWNQVHVSPAFEPDYCYRAGNEWWRG